MAGWTYRCYSSGDPNAWEAWYRGERSRVQGKHDSVFEILEQLLQPQWTKPHVKKLTGRPEIWEVIIKTDVEWRIFGWFNQTCEFTVTGIGNHKDKVYTPKQIIKTSRKRRVAIEAGTLEVFCCARPK